MFQHAFSVLPTDVAAQIIDIVNKAPEDNSYDTFKRTVISRLSDSQEKLEARTPSLLTAQQPDVLTEVVEKLEPLVPDVSSQPGDKQRPRFSKQSDNSPKHRNQICYYHRMYGDDARKCQPGCKYPMNGTFNPQGNFTAGQYGRRLILAITSVASFILRNTVQSFQRFMNQVFYSLDFVFAYIDDALIISSNPEEHKMHLRQIEIDFPGHCLNKFDISPLPEKAQPVMDYSIPYSVKSLRRFLGMVNYYAGFIPNSAQILQPLTDLFKRVTRLVLKTDASQVEERAVLQQIVNGEIQPLSFFSRKLTPTETRFSTFDRELLAIYLAVKHFRHILEGRQFTILTEHKPLTLAKHPQIVILPDECRKKLLQPPYYGPFKALERKPKYIILDHSGKRESLSIDQLKLAYLELFDVNPKPSPIVFPDNVQTSTSRVQSSSQGTVKSTTSPSCASRHELSRTRCVQRITLPSRLADYVQ
ncbi:unnamed protein product [Hymenolepis diminuta]|uniref:Reverse transcriptase RNase H-like domain-containing protein n=1 Tax=Hymenolepis diminuta TaxID=6216 RepID=A0A564Z4A9_HYMDI|nr:unnamed protein product [Hymenolepis diminuta]